MFARNLETDLNYEITLESKNKTPFIPYTHHFMSESVP